MNNNILGKRIREQRKALNMSQEQLADILMLPKQSISQYENGTAVRHDRLIELAHALKTTPNYLLGFDDNQDPFVNTMCQMLQGITDETTKEILKKMVTSICQ